MIRVMGFGIIWWVSRISFMGFGVILWFKIRVMGFGVIWWVSGYGCWCHWWVSGIRVMGFGVIWCASGIRVIGFGIIDTKKSWIWVDRAGPVTTCSGRPAAPGIVLSMMLWSSMAIGAASTVGDRLKPVCHVPV